MYLNQHLPIEQVLAEAKASFDKSLDVRYEAHFMLGYLESAYNSLYNDFQELLKEQETDNN
jgi:hypothetical protein